MTSRQLFEKLMKRKGITPNRTQEPTRNGPRWVYNSYSIQLAWEAWVARARLKARQ